MEKVGDFPDMRAYFDAFPELSARILGYIGKQAAMQLFNEEMQGKNAIKVRADHFGSTGSPKGEEGRRLVSYSVGRGLKWVAVSSFPLNLYENRKQLRSGDEKRKGIIRRKLASGLSGRLGDYIAGAENLIVDDWFMERKKGKGMGVARL